MSKHTYRKIFIVGRQCTSKAYIAGLLENAGVVVGSTFRSIESDGTFYDCHSVQYDTLKINRLFELNAYKFYCQNTSTDSTYTEGLSDSEYDNGQVFVMTPHQFTQMSKFDKNDIVVWIDDTLSVRRNRHNEEHRTYDFLVEERYENANTEEFVERVGDIENILYFSNDVPMRIFAVVYTLVKHPELLDIYKLCYN